MPLIHEGNPMPGWCELRSFSIVRHYPGKVHILRLPRDMKHVLIVGRGSVALYAHEQVYEEGAIIPVDGDTVIMRFDTEDATVIQMSGHWGDDYGGLGIFGMRETEDPHNAGDPVEYPRLTSFDNHFHDCDEYWIIFEGRGVAVSEGIHYDVGPGDCIATGMGHHHDMPGASEPVRGVFFETTMDGQKRRGHLWEHTHGPAKPHPDRV
jgi:mannose-6-phosphate isomerase-like protein (cupin superfamily)